MLDLLCCSTVPSFRCPWI